MKTPIETTAVRRYSRVKRALKGLEQIVKYSLLQVLTRIAAPRAKGAPDWKGTKIRVLFLRHDRIGDMILSTGVIRAIARSHRNIELDVLASPANAAVIEKDPLVHRVVRFNVHCLREFWPLFRHLRKTRYDMVVDCMVFKQSLTTMLLMLATQAPYRVGVLKRDAPNIYTLFAELAGEKAHHVEHLAQLALPFEVRAEDALQLEIVLTGAERAEALTRWNSGSSPRLLVNISVGKAFRQWPDENFTAIALHLKALLPDATVVILHAPGERERARRIGDAAGVSRADTPGVREALAMVATSDFVFTPDTSIVHAASAFRVPAVAMVTPDHKIRWGLYGTLGDVVVSPGDTLATVPLSMAVDAVNNVFRKLEAAMEGGEGAADVVQRRGRSRTAA